MSNFSRITLALALSITGCAGSESETDRGSGGKGDDAKHTTASPGSFLYQSITLPDTGNCGLEMSSWGLGDFEVEMDDDGVGFQFKGGRITYDCALDDTGTAYDCPGVHSEPKSNAAWSMRLAWVSGDRIEGTLSYDLTECESDDPNECKEIKFGLDDLPCTTERQVLAVRAQPDLEPTEADYAVTSGSIRYNACEPEVVQLASQLALNKTPEGFRADEASDEHSYKCQAEPGGGMWCFENFDLPELKLTQGTVFELMWTSETVAEGAVTYILDCTDFSDCPANDEEFGDKFPCSVVHDVKLSLADPGE